MKQINIPQELKQKYIQEIEDHKDDIVKYPKSGIGAYTLATLKVRLVLYIWAKNSQLSDKQKKFQAAVLLTALDIASNHILIELFKKITPKLPKKIGEKLLNLLYMISAKVLFKKREVTKTTKALVLTSIVFASNYQELGTKTSGKDFRSFLKQLVTNSAFFSQTENQVINAIMTFTIPIGLAAAISEESSKEAAERLKIQKYYFSVFNITEFLLYISQHTAKGIPLKTAVKTRLYGVGLHLILTLLHRKNTKLKYLAYALHFLWNSTLAFLVAIQGYKQGLSTKSGEFVEEKI